MISDASDAPKGVFTVFPRVALGQISMIAPPDDARVVVDGGVSFISVGGDRESGVVIVVVLVIGDLGCSILQGSQVVSESNGHRSSCSATCFFLCGGCIFI